jgi:hypothetical protein
MFSSSILAGASGQGGGFYPFEIEQSLRFEAGDTAYLSQNMSASNRKTFTISVWVKRSELNGDIIMGRRVDGDNQWAFQFTSGDQLDFYNQTSGSVTVRMITNAVFRDVSAWYNIVLKVDVTTGTSANAIYVNGVEQSLSTDTSSNSDTYVNSAGTHYIGAFQAAGSYDGYMADFNFIDGQALDPTSFGETKSGIWIPKDTSGLTFGTNGFRLQFGNSAAIGDDTSGNTNDWTANNLVASDVVLDSPTNNWCVWSPLTADSSAQFKEGNLEAAAADNRGVMASFNMPSGKWYWEVRKDANSTLIGIAPDTLGTEDVPNSSGENGVFYYFDGRVFQNGSNLGNYGSFTNGDIIGMTFDSSNREIKFYKNNSLAHTVTAAAGFTYAPAISAGSADAFVQGNFGQDSTFAGNTTAGGNTDGSGVGDFKYAPPSGFLSLCSFNLPEDDMETLKGETPADYFNIVGYVGNDPSAQSITGLGFEPGWVWMKNNTASERHCLYDIVRGINLRQSTNASLVDGDTGAVSSFDADGWTLAADNATRENTNGENYVAWSWKLGGSPANNTDGTVTSSVSAGSTNSDRKWVSVVTYTGTGATGTYGHGLSAAPKLIWTKCRNDATPEWAVFATGLGTGKYLELNNSSAPVTDANIYTSVDATTIGLGAENHADSPTNTSGDTYVSYCWTDSEGLCKSGTYTGNSQDPNGTFVYTGFRPRYLWIRSISSARDGLIVDTFRSPINPNSLLLRTNTTQASSTDTTMALDILSNGFKLRDNTVTINNSSNDYVYLAIAEQPFKYANAR